MDSEHPFHNKGSGLVKSKRKLFYGLAATIGLAVLVFFPGKDNGYLSASILPIKPSEVIELGHFPLTKPNVKYGFTLDTFNVYEDKVRSNHTLSTLLSELGLESKSIEEVIRNSEGVFNVNRGLISGKNYTVLTRQGDEKPSHLIFEPSVYHYIKFDLTGDRCVNKVLYPVETKMVSLAGVIESSLWDALIRQGVNLDAAAKMEDALQWSVDFSHALKGDEFKIVYDENSIEGTSVGAGRVYAAYYKRENKDFYAIWFENGEYKGYYDLEGRPTAKGFLKSPVKYTRISSRFNRARFHPILKYVRPHLGTDYAAPHGTPIYAVGEGVVTEAAYGRGNGNYVSIKHDKTFQTQYLHMSRFAKGIRRGTHVSQGQVIGYVGSTGLATGPHVCFRFWKNGKQVNHLRLELPKPKPLPNEVLDDYFAVRDKFVKLLRGEQFYANPQNLNTAEEGQLTSP